VINFVSFRRWHYSEVVLLQEGETVLLLEIVFFLLSFRMDRRLT
jgi:hypothetical protein